MLRRTTFALSIITSMSFTILVLTCSRATFGDIRKSAHFIRDEIPEAAEIVSSEITKIEFWSGRDVGKYDRSKLEPGMYVALQNVYCDFQWEMDNLKREYNFSILYRNEGTVIPILADDMYMKPVKRKDGTMGQRGAANNLISLRTQFGKHGFESVVLLIKARRAT